MGETLMGGERSGTPVETRGGAQSLGNIYSQLLGSGNPFGLGSQMGRNTTDALINMLGFDPTQIGLDQAAIQSLMHPGDTTAGLFRSMLPFEAEETARQTAGMREMFGTMGGRFSRNLGSAEGNLRGELAGQFGRNREQALLTAQGQRIQSMLGLMGATNQARGQAFNEQMMPLQLMQSFLQPGAPVIQEGMLPGLLQLGGTAALMYLTGGMGAPAAAAAGAAGGAAGTGMRPRA
jgi:hypothetical protein